MDPRRNVVPHFVGPKERDDQVGVRKPERKGSELEGVLIQPLDPRKRCSDERYNEQSAVNGQCPEIHLSFVPQV
jgi:hypothetical protein